MGPGTLTRSASLAEILEFHITQTVMREASMPRRARALDRCSQLAFQCTGHNATYSLITEHLPAGQAANIFRSILRAPLLETIHLSFGDHDEEGPRAVRELGRALQEGRLGNPRRMKGKARMASRYTSAAISRQVRKELRKVCSANGIENSLEISWKDSMELPDTDSPEQN